MASFMAHAFAQAGVGAATLALSLSPMVNTSSGRLSAYHSSLPGVESPRIGLNIIDGAGLPHLDGVSLADLRRCVPYVSICPLRRRSSTTPSCCPTRWLICLPTVSVGDCPAPALRDNVREDGNNDAGQANVAGPPGGRQHPFPQRLL